MKKWALIFTFLLFTLNLFGQEFNFRGFLWGTLINSIITKEGEPDSINDYIENPNLPLERQEISLSYQRYILGYNANLLFTLNKASNKLIAASYTFRYDIENSNKILEELLSMLLITEKQTRRIINPKARER